MLAQCCLYIYTHKIKNKVLLYLHVIFHYITSTFCYSIISECSNGTYGYECRPCSEHCVNSSCNKFSENGDCLHGCEVGYTTKNCTEGINLAVSLKGPRLENCIFSVS